jgi:hypothetical protein
MKTEKMKKAVDKTAEVMSKNGAYTSEKAHRRAVELAKESERKRQK